MGGHRAPCDLPLEGTQCLADGKPDLDRVREVREFQRPKRWSDQGSAGRIPRSMAHRVRIASGVTTLSAARAHTGRERGWRRMPKTWTIDSLPINHGPNHVGPNSEAGCRGDRYPQSEQPLIRR